MNQKNKGAHENLYCNGLMGCFDRKLIKWIPNVSNNWKQQIQKKKKKNQTSRRIQENTIIYHLEQTFSNNYQTFRNWKELEKYWTRPHRDSSSKYSSNWWSGWLGLAKPKGVDAGRVEQWRWGCRLVTAVSLVFYF